MNKLQKIFINHYEEMKYTLHPRQSVLESVEKMINCGDPSYDGTNITFHYNRHEDEKLIVETIPVLDKLYEKVMQKNKFHT